MEQSLSIFLPAPQPCCGAFGLPFTSLGIAGSHRANVLDVPQSEKQVFVFCRALVFLKKPVKMPLWCFPSQCLAISAFSRVWVNVLSAFQHILPGDISFSTKFFPLNVLSCLSGQSSLSRAYLACKEALKAYNFPLFSVFFMGIFLSFESF